MAAALAFASPAKADQRYLIAGTDRYRIGSTDIKTSISYSGTQQLTIRRSGKQTLFTASAKYDRIDESGKVPDRASFVQVLTPGGDLQDRTDDDPDYVTVLNQPFAVELDAQTLHDLLQLQGRVPFGFPAPLMGGTLHGYLERGPGRQIGSQPALGVDFHATGPMEGPLPDRPAMTMRGTMRMDGRAYYALHGDPLLLALTETLTISGTLTTGAQHSPVTIIYERTIKADPTSGVKTEADSH